MARTWGSGTAAVARRMLQSSQPVRQRDLAESCRVTQPRISQVLAAFESKGLVQRDAAGWIANRAPLSRAYLERYRARQIEAETYWYGLDPIHVQVSRLIAAAPAPVVISADYAADLTVPWRAPTTTIVWTTEAPPMVSLVAAESRASASLIVRLTTDTRLLADAEEVDGLLLADPLQQVIDLIDLGGADRVEAAERLLQRTFADRPRTNPPAMGSADRRQVDSRHG